MNHWLRVLGFSVLPAIVLCGATPAFAEEPSKAAAASHTPRVKPPAPPVAKTAPVKASGGSQVMLNPQPIPPGKAAAGPSAANGASKVMLNPQPIPPGKAAAGPSAANGASKVMLNPQPIPPGKAAAGPSAANGASKVMLNPQPIPPGKATTGAPAKTNGSEKAIIFVGGKSTNTKQKAAPKAAPVAKTAS
jgi:hypothetical protein